MLALCLISFLQIILESLPVSSSGHIVLMERIVQSLGNLKILLGLPCYKYLEQLLHLPSVVVLTIFICTFLKSSFKSFKNCYVSLFLFVAIADFITVLLYFSIHKEIKLFPHFYGFIITFILIYLTQYFPRYENKSANKLSVFKAVALGFVQGIALVPGISRLGITFFTGRLLGFSGQGSLLISFLLAIPLFIAGGSKGLIGVCKSIGCYNNIFTTCFFASIVLASLVAFLLLICLKWLIDNNKYWLLSIYMIVPILISFFF